MMMMMMMMMIRFTLSSRRAQPLRLKTNGEEDKDHQRHNRTSSGAIYIHTHNYMSFLNRKPCRRVVVLALVLVVIPLSGRMFYVNKLDWFARRRMMMMMMSSSDGVRARATAREEEVIEEQQRGKMVAKQQHPREEEEEEEEEKRPKPLEAPTT